MTSDILKCRDCPWRYRCCGNWSYWPSVQWHRATLLYTDIDLGKQIMFSRFTLRRLVMLMKTSAMFCSIGCYVLLHTFTSKLCATTCVCISELIYWTSFVADRFVMVYRMIAQGTSQLRQLLVTLFNHQERGHPGFSVFVFPVLPLTAATFLYHLTKLASEAVWPAVSWKSVGCVAWLRGQRLILFGNRCASCSQQKHLFLCVVSNIVFLW